MGSSVTVPSARVSCSETPNRVSAAATSALAPMAWQASARQTRRIFFSPRTAAKPVVESDDAMNFRNGKVEHLCNQGQCGFRHVPERVLDRVQHRQQRAGHAGERCDDGAQPGGIRQRPLPGCPCDGSSRAAHAATPSVDSCCTSSSVKSRLRVRKRTPSGPSSENIPPRPGTTSMMSWVCFQYSNWAALM